MRNDECGIKGSLFLIHHSSFRIHHFFTCGQPSASHFRMMILSVGDEDKYKKSKDLIVRALIGLTIVLLSAAAVYFVVGLFE